MDKLSDVARVVQLSSNETGSCPVCHAGHYYKDLEDGINHIMAAHGYKLLHIGTQSSFGYDREHLQHTVAVLGKSLF